MHGQRAIGPLSTYRRFCRRCGNDAASRCIGLRWRLGRHRVCRCNSLPLRRSRHRWRQHCRPGTGGIDRYSLRRLRGGDDCWLCRREVRRDEHDAQIRHLDPSISPREGEARKAPFVATEPQAQQKGVNEQGEQERNRQWPAFTTRALDTPQPWTGGARKTRRRRMRGEVPLSPGMQAMSWILASPVRLQARQARARWHRHFGVARDSHGAHLVDFHGSSEPSLGQPAQARDGPNAIAGDPSAPSIVRSLTGLAERGWCSSSPR